MAVVADVVAAAVVSVCRDMRLATPVLCAPMGHLHQPPVAAAVMVVGQWQSHPRPPLRLSNSSLTNGAVLTLRARKDEAVQRRCVVGRSGAGRGWTFGGAPVVCVVPLRPHRRLHKDPQLIDHVAVAAWVRLRPPLALCSAHGPWRCCYSEGPDSSGADCLARMIPHAATQARG
jgi:hypothetical protein